MTHYRFEVVAAWGETHRIAGVATDPEAAERFRSAQQAARGRDVQLVPFDVPTFPSQVGDSQ
jgi:hypothetical protein